jgi:hypothetical protein
MRPYCSLTDARPKISSMPRPKTEAAAYLNLYKLAVEKKRLQYELDTIEQRRERIQKRLAFLESEVAELQKAPQPTQEVRPPVRSIVSKASPDKAAFKTMFLEY